MNEADVLELLLQQKEIDIPWKDRQGARAERRPKFTGVEGKWGHTVTVKR
jgi:hypothetical protein